MSKRKKFLALGVSLLIIGGLLAWYVWDKSFPMMDPGGKLGHEELMLIILCGVIAAVVVIPTYAIAIMIAVKYNEKNVTEKTKYRPDFDHSRLFESIWWGIPIIIIGFLSYVAWTSSHDLSPYKALASDKKQLVVQVVNLDWKWLFIYPEQNVASVNLAEIPANTPVDFQLTSDTIMNSFWVPSLGGQMYVMPGMITQIHEQANRLGDYAGSPANIAGKGFARMDFTIRAASDASFNNWVASAKKANRPLDAGTYAALAKPSMGVPVSYYSSIDPDLFMNIAMKYMMPMTSAKKASGNSTSGTSAPMTMPKTSSPTSASGSNVMMKSMEMKS